MSSCFAARLGRAACAQPRRGTPHPAVSRARCHGPPNHAPQAKRRRSLRVAAALRALTQEEPGFPEALRLLSPGRASRAAAVSAAVFRSIDARQPGKLVSRQRSVAYRVDVLSEAGGAGSWELVPASPPSAAQRSTPAKRTSSPSLAALLTSPAGQQRAGHSGEDTPMGASLRATPASKWASPGSPLAVASNRRASPAMPGSGGAGGGAGGGGGGGGPTPPVPHRRESPVPSPAPRPHSRQAGLTAILALGVATGLARQAARLKEGSHVGLSLVRRAVAACSSLRPRKPIEEAALLAGACAAPTLRAALGSLRGDSGAPCAPFPRMYSVREEDTLWGIAEEAYGDGQRFADILAANPGLLEAVSEQGEGLIAGSFLRLPPP